MVSQRPPDLLTGLDDGRLAHAVRRFARRHPVLVRRMRVGWTVWSWLSLVLFAAALVLVPSARAGARPWLWCYWILIVWFLLARTKTLSWGLVALTFTGACLLAPLIGLADVAVAGLLDADINGQDGAVLVAGPAEETLKLLPLGVLAVVARPRVRRLAVVDWLLLGLAAGLGFQAVEDAMRRLALTVRPGGLLGMLAELLRPDPDDPAGGLPQYGLGLLPGWSDHAGEAFFAGHHVGTALVAVAVGLALRGRQRLGSVLWLLPAGLLGMVVVDHAMFNAVSSGAVPPPGVPGVRLPEVRGGGPFAIDLHLVQVPEWLVRVWDLWGNGSLQRPLLVGLLLVGMAADADRLLRVGALLPPLPEVTWTALPARWGQALATRAPHPRTDAARLVRRARSAAATLAASAGVTVTVVTHELALLAAATNGEPPSRTHTAGPPSAWRRWARTIAYLRLRRELGQHLGRTVERTAPPTRSARPVAATQILLVTVVGVLAMALLAGTAILDNGIPDQFLGFLANLFDDLADWWNGLPLWQQLLVVAAAAGLLTFGGMGLLPALSLASGATWLLAHGHGAADLLRNPAQATRRFLTTLTPGQLLGYAAEVVIGRLMPAAFGGVVGRGFRDQLDDLLDLVDDPAQVRRYIAQRRAQLAELRQDEAGAIRILREDDDFFAARTSRGRPKAHIHAATGDLVPAAPTGNATIVEHIIMASSKGRSPYISFYETEGKVLGQFGRHRIELHMDALERELQAGRIQGVQVLRHDEIQAQLRAQASAITDVDYTRALAGSVRNMQRYVASLRHGMPREQFLDLNRLLHAVYYNHRWSEHLVKGIIPARYYTGPYP